MDVSLYKVWINRFSPTRGQGEPAETAQFAGITIKCMYFVTKAFSLIEFTGFFFHPITIPNRSRTCLHAAN